MAANTGIAWTQKTWNPWAGCSRVSPGCRNCYMFTLLRRQGRDPAHVRRTNTWADPLRWDAAAAAAGTPALVFTCSLSDWFHEDADAWRPEAWELVRRCTNLRFQILSKRPLRIADHLPPDWGGGYPNVWLGTSIEDNEHVWRADVLRKIPARTRFISAEPLLGPLPDLDLRGFHWLIVGGESGPGYRPMDRAWAKQLRDMAKAKNMAFFFKQSAGPRPGHGDLLDGRQWHEFPPIFVEGQKPDLPLLGFQMKWTKRKIKSTQPEAQGDDRLPHQCPHETAESRFALIPRLMRARREDGTSHLELISVFDGIRSCCIADVMVRPAWWNHLGRNVISLMESGKLELPADMEWKDMVDSVIDMVQGTVPFPTREEWQAFRAYETELRRRVSERLEAEKQAWLAQERERKRLEEEQRKKWEERRMRLEEEWKREEEVRRKKEFLDQQARIALEAAERHRAEEEERIRNERKERVRQLKEESARFRESIRDFAKAHGLPFVVDPQDIEVHLRVLGLTWPCTKEEVAKAHRRLAFAHHPDRGGDAEKFKEIQFAYERAMELFIS